MFITLEGPEGAGKSTLHESLGSKFRHLQREVVLTREPGGSSFGEEVRRILLGGEQIYFVAEMFLFLADRAQHVAGVIVPAIRAGKVVISDRFADSTLAYQGYGRGLEVEQLRAWNLIATGGCVPDITFLLDIDPTIGLSRLREQDRMDSEPMDFHMRVRDGFLALAKAEPARWVVLDASASPEQVLRAAWSQIEPRLSRL